MRHLAIGDMPGEEPAKSAQCRASPSGTRPERGRRRISSFLSPCRVPYGDTRIPGSTLFSEVAQSSEDRRPIPLVFRHPWCQCGRQHVRLQSINLFSTPARRGHQACSPQAHQMLRDSRSHQTRELAGQLTYRQGTTLGQQIKDLPACRVRQDPEQSVAIGGHLRRLPGGPISREFGERRLRAHSPRSNRRRWGRQFLRIRRE